MNLKRSSICIVKELDSTVFTNIKSINNVFKDVNNYQKGKQRQENSFKVQTKNITMRKLSFSVFFSMLFLKEAVENNVKKKLNEVSWSYK